MIRKITLENFMSHAKTEIELADGLTVLTGPNNCGKSALVAALQTIAANGNTSHVIRHDAKICRITVETDDDHTVVWERKKKGSVKYTIDGEDIHRIGQKVPPQLHDILRLDRVSAEIGASKNEYDIHFGQQKTPVFLLDETGSRAAAFFASSSDASRLIEMQGNHRTRVRDSKSEAKRLTTELENTQKRLLSYQPVNVIVEKVEVAAKQREKIQRTEQQIARVLELRKQLDTTRANQVRLIETIKVLDQLDQTDVTPAALEAGCEKTDRLRTGLQAAHAAITARDRGHAFCNALARLCTPKTQHATGSLRTLLTKLRQTQDQQRRSSDVQSACGPLTSPPTLQPTEACRQVVIRLQSQARTQQQINLVVSRLDLLSRPPESLPTDQLRRVVKSIQNLELQTQRLQDIHSVFVELRDISSPVETKPYRDTLDRLCPLVKTVEKAREKAQQARQKVEAYETSIKEFVHQNPKCETCGGEINPETLMSTLPHLHSHESDDSTPSGDNS